MSENNANGREMLGSRLGFILLAAGCAIGLGNIWRFPYITGQYGGAIFLLLYLFFLVILGFPCMVIELSIGRSGRSSLVGCFRNLKNPVTRVPWVPIGKIAFAGNLILLMFYTVVTGWLLSYAYDFILGIAGHGPFAQETLHCEELFGGFLGNWQRQTLFMVISVLLALFICILGLRSGVERMTKFMMGGLFILMLILACHSLSLKGAAKGMAFFLKPNLDTLQANGFWPAVHAAMAQAFFTLSLGIGALSIVGSYADKKQSLAKEAAIIISLDTFVAICAGIIIFPCCFTFDVNPGGGPALIFITLPQVFTSMPYGFYVGALFFLFLSIAALTTLIAVTETLISFCIDELKIRRVNSTLLVCGILILLSFPCIFGFNIWSGFQPLGKGSSILDLEDFIVSSNILPLGSLAMALFCMYKCGWGRDNFFSEANIGSGLKFPRWLTPYLTYVLPTIIILIWALGLAQTFHLI